MSICAVSEDLVNSTVGSLGIEIPRAAVLVFVDAHDG
jgi:hypothetical protein